MKMVVGLGNPGKQYERTRHNIGFDVLRCIAERYGAGTPRQRFQAELAEVRIHNEKVILLSPLTFMNRSGASVQPARDFFQIEHHDILVITDDLNIDVAQLRIRSKGSAGGQKGLADILQRLGGQDVPRLRVGIGPVPKRWDAADFVLGKFNSEEQPQVDQVIGRAADAVADWVEHGLAWCMNRYNTKPKKPKQPKPKKQQPEDVSTEPEASD